MADPTPDELLEDLRYHAVADSVPDSYSALFDRLDRHCRAGRLPEAWSRHPGIAAVGESVVKTADMEKAREGYAALEAEVARLRAQRDALVEAAEVARSFLTWGPPLDNEWRRVISVLFTAIAQARGEAQA